MPTLGLEAQVRGQIHVAGDDVHLPARVMALEVLRPFRPERYIFLHAFTVRGIGHQPARLAIHLQATGIRNGEAYRLRGEHGPLTIALGRRDSTRVDVVAHQRRVQPGGDPAAGFVLDVAPVTGVVAAQPLETERAPDAGWYAQRDPRGFNEYGSTAAKGVE